MMQELRRRLGLNNPSRPTRVKPEKWVSTTCGYCSVGCGMEIGVRDGVAIASRGLEHHPVNRGKLCPKGLAEHHMLSSSNRARQPLLRKAGRLVEVGWDEAIGALVSNFRYLRTLGSCP